jgi:TRAP-type transport system periplasmic protein
MVLRRGLSRERFLGALGSIGAMGAPMLVRADDATFTLRMNIPTAANSLYALAGLRLASTAGRRSNGRLKIEVYPNGALSTEKGAVAELALGVVDLTIIATSLLVPLLPQYQIFDVPFLYKNLSAGYRVLDGPIGDELFATLDPKGIVGLAWISNGFKELETTGKAVVTPADMKGLRIRTQSSPVYFAAYQALGATPITVDIAETYVALTQHTIDGIDLSLDSFIAGKFNNIVKHVAMLNQVFNVLPLLGSKRKIDVLPPDLQKILKEESKSVLRYARALATQKESDAKRLLKDEGIAVTDIEYPAFRKAMDPVYVLAQSKIGADLIDRVSRISSAG